MEMHNTEEKAVDDPLDYAAQHFEQAAFHMAIAARALRARSGTTISLSDVKAEEAAWPKNPALHSAEKAKTKKTRDPNEPKRPMSSFIKFCSERRSSIKKLHPTMLPNEIMQKLSAIWRALEPVEREKYDEEYRKNWADYKAKLLEYKKQHDGGAVSVIEEVATPSLNNGIEHFENSEILSSPDHVMSVATKRKKHEHEYTTDEDDGRPLKNADEAEVDEEDEGEEAEEEASSKKTSVSKPSASKVTKKEEKMTKEEKTISLAATSKSGLKSEKHDHKKRQRKAKAKEEEGSLSSSSSTDLKRKIKEKQSTPVKRVRKHKSKDRENNGATKGQ